QRLAVHAHVGVRDLVVGVQHLACGVGDAALAEHPRDLLAAAVAEVGQQLHQLHRPAHRARTASTTLKPSRATTSRTLPKPAPSAASYGRCWLATSHSRPPDCSAAAAAAMKARPRSGRSSRPAPWKGGLV